MTSHLINGTPGYPQSGVSVVFQTTKSMAKQVGLGSARRAAGLRVERLVDAPTVPSPSAQERSP